MLPLSSKNADRAVGVKGTMLQQCLVQDAGFLEFACRTYTVMLPLVFGCVGKKVAIVTGGDVDVVSRKGGASGRRIKSAVARTIKIWQRQTIDSE